MILQPIHIIYKACYLRVHKKCKYIFLFTGCLDRKNKQEKVKRKKYMFGSKKKMVHPGTKIHFFTHA